MAFTLAKNCDKATHSCVYLMNVMWALGKFGKNDGEYDEKGCITQAFRRRGAYEAVYAKFQRLRLEETRKTNHLNLLYTDRLDGTITKEQYLEKQAVIQQELRGIQADIEKLGRYNAKYREEGSAIIDLLKDFKQTYDEADEEGKAVILSAVIDKALSGTEISLSPGKGRSTPCSFLVKGFRENKNGVPERIRTSDLWEREGLYRAIR
jgi:hypothetical protein